MFLQQTFVTCIIVYSMMNSWSVGKANPLSVSPTEPKIQVGEKVEVECKHSNSSQQKFLIWLNPNMTKINQTNSTRITSSNGTLTVDKSEESDSGTYVCIHNNGIEPFNATCKLTVYVMPDYFLTGMIIIGINAVLIVIFMACTIFHFIKKRKARKKKTKSDRKSHL